MKSGNCSGKVVEFTKYVALGLGIATPFSFEFPAFTHAGDRQNNSEPLSDDERRRITHDAGLTSVPDSPWHLRQVRHGEANK
jgi:hypothetical protein